MDKELKHAIIEFLEMFEEVFDNDWVYTKSMMGIHDETEKQKQSAIEFGLETIDIISDNGTFINPKVTDETEDWGNRGALLNKYRKLKTLLK